MRKKTSICETDEKPSVAYVSKLFEYESYSAEY